MIDDAAFLLLLLLAGRGELLEGGIGIAAIMLLAAALTALRLFIGLPAGFGLLLLLGYTLAINLAGLARGETGAPPLMAGLAAGVLALTGPVGVIAGTTAIASHCLIDARRSDGRSVAVAAVLLFVPLAALASYAAAALIETGLLHSIEAGPAPYLRGRPVNESTLAAALPGLLPLAMMATPRLRAEAGAALALLSGGIVAALALESAAPVLPLALAGAFAAGASRPLLLVLALALGSGALAAPGVRPAEDVPVVAPWRIDAETAEALPAWGVAETFAAEHPGRLPRLERVDGRYVFLLDGRRVPADLPDGSGLRQ